MGDLEQNSNLTVQFTANHEDYMHRDLEGLFKDLLLDFYTMGVYATKKPTSSDPLAAYMLEVPFDVSYGGTDKTRSRLSTVPRVPQLEGIYIPSPDVNPHMLPFIKLILFKPMHALEVDARGNPLAPLQESV